MDWNCDGKKDLVIGVETGVQGQDTGGLIRVYLNTGTDAAPVFNYGSTGYVNVKVGSSDFDCGHRATPDILDWDNDGDLDLICGEYDGVVNLLINNAGPGTSPTFSGSTLIKRSGGANIDVGSSSHPVAFDWTGDGKKDLLVGASTGTVLLFENVGTDAAPVFDTSVVIEAGGATLDVGTYSRPEVCDYDSDGVSDLLSGASDGTVKFFRRTRLFYLDIPAEATEGDGTLATQGSVWIDVPATGDTVVALECVPTGELTVPTNVTISAGETNAVFDVTVIDDPDLDGSQTVTLTATSPGFGNCQALTIVHDNESTTLTVELPATATEGDAPLSAVVRLAAPPEKDVKVNLTSSDASEATVPPQIIVPAHGTNGSFFVNIVDDALIDGTQTAIITAHVDNWTDGSSTLDIADNEPTNLTVFLPALVGEGEGTIDNAGAVSISGTLDHDLTVMLTSHDTSEVRVPASCTITAGEVFALFDLTVEDDGGKDGMQIVSVSATATGFAAGTATVSVADNEADSLVLDDVPSPQTVAVPFALTVRMCDIIGSNAAFSGTVSLTGEGDSGGVVVEPTEVALMNGEWTGMVTVRTVDGNVRLTGHHSRWLTDVTAPFDVVPGSVDHFGIAAVPSPQAVGVPFPVVVSALDANEYVVSGFTGTADLSAADGEPGGGPILITEVNHGTPDAIEFVNVSTEPEDISGWTVHIYEDGTVPMPVFTFPAGTVCGAGEIFVLQETGTSPGTWPLFRSGANIVWVSSTPAAVMLRNSSGEIVDFFCAGSRNPSLITDPVSVPGTEWNGAPVPTPGGNTTYHRKGSEDTNAADDWEHAMAGVGSPHAGLVLPFVTATPLRMSPATSGAFTGGVWSGSVTILDGGDNVSLTAVYGTASGRSGAFRVSDGSLPATCAVTGGTDDAQERTGRFQEAATGGHLLVMGTGDYLATGLRFCNVPVPADSEIVAASVQFVAATASVDAVELTIRGERTPDAAPFVEGGSFNISGRTQTSNAVVWNVEAWAAADDAGSAQQTPDLAGIVQEIVSQPGWASNQAVCLVMEHGGSTGTRTAYAYDGDPAKAAVLHLTYRGPDVDLDGDGLPDRWEITNFGSITNSSGQACDDYDGDGMCDWGEYRSGTDPTSSNSVLSFTQADLPDAAELVLQWASVAGKTYAVRRASDLSAGFVTLTNGLPATPPVNVYTVTVEQAAGHVFYRILVE